MSYSGADKRLLEIDVVTAKRRKQSLAIYEGKVLKLQERIKLLVKEKEVKKLELTNVTIDNEARYQAELSRLSLECANKNELLDITKGAIAEGQKHIKEQAGIIADGKKEIIAVNTKLTALSNKLTQLEAKERHDYSLATKDRLKAEKTLEQAEKFAKQAAAKRIQLEKSFNQKEVQFSNREAKVALREKDLALAEQASADKNKDLTAKADAIADGYADLENATKLQEHLKSEREAVKQELANTKRWAEEVKSESDQNAVLRVRLQRKEADLKKREKYLKENESAFSGGL